MQHNSHEVSPFGHPRINSCEADPRGFSQPTTSFVGVLCQGILCVRLSNFLRIRFCDASASAGQSPSLAAACGALLRQSLRYSFTVFKYYSVRCSALPCIASTRKTVFFERVHKCIPSVIVQTCPALKPERSSL